MEASLNLAINKILATAAKRRALNVHLTVGAYPVLRIDDELVELAEEQIVTQDFINQLAGSWVSDLQKTELEKEKAIIFVKEVSKNLRLKINFFYQKGSLAASFRLIPTQISPLINLGLPKSIYGLADKKSGLIIVCGPYGSGRTTTAASIIQEINKSRKENIITIEKPIEYLIANQKSLIEQREVGRDANSFIDALNYAQQADVDIIAVGASQEEGIIPLVLEFASSGRLAILVMDTNSVVQTLEEILSAFRPEEKLRAQSLLSESLLAVISQRLVPRAGGGLILAAEVLFATEPVQSLIAEGRIKQLTTILQTSRAEGMLSLDQALAELVSSGEVLIDKAVEYAADPQNFRAIAKS
ncbi:MAG: ATPase, T2SS/T4P/T4SS family [Candidatus Buchananbacteria bacterium]